MKSIILYAAKHGTGCSGAFWPVHISGKGSDKLGPVEPVFVRAEIVEADVQHALEMARPEPDEILLNTIPADANPETTHS